jgi:4-carboxymuconolactone decarboxylase
MSARIEPVQEPYPEEVAAELAAMMPEGMKPLILFRALARNPRILRKIHASNLLDRGSLDRRDRELVILRTCGRCGSEYEWGVHAAIFARRFALTDAEVRGSVHATWSDPLWSDRDRALVRLVDELHDEARISEDLWRLLASLYHEDQLIELIVLVGFYHTISFVTNGLNLPLETDAERFPRASVVVGSDCSK